MNTDVYVTRISLPDTPNLEQAIKAVCDIQAGLDNPRRLIGTFEAQNELTLLFELYNQS